MHKINYTGDIKVIKRLCEMVNELIDRGAGAVEDLTDVELTNLANGQILKYDSLNEQWVNANDAGGVDEFSQLSDVALDNLQNGQVPKWNSLSEKWENADESGGTTVVANPSGTPTADLNSIQIDTDIYRIVGGGAGGGGSEIIPISAGDGTTSRTFTLSNTPKFVSISWTEGDTSAAWNTSYWFNWGDRRAYGMGGDTDSMTYGQNAKVAAITYGADGKSFTISAANAGSACNSSGTDHHGFLYVDYGGGGGGGASALEDLTDVDLTSLSNGQILKWNAAAQKWVNANESGGGGGVDTDMIAEDFDSSTSYTGKCFVIHEGKLYYRDFGSMTWQGNWNPSIWTEINVTDGILDLTNPLETSVDNLTQADALTRSFVSENFNNSSPYSNGDYTIKDSLLYKNIREDGVGASGWDSTKWQNISNLASEVKAVNKEIVAPYDSTSGTYSVGDYCNHNGNIYRCTTAISTPEAFDSNKWQLVSSVMDEMSECSTTSLANKANIADEYSSSVTYGYGEYCIYNNQLYRCTTAVSTAEAFDPAKWTATTIGEMLSSVRNASNWEKTIITGDSNSSYLRLYNYTNFAQLNGLRLDFSPNAYGFRLYDVAGGTTTENFNLKSELDTRTKAIYVGNVNSSSAKTLSFSNTVCGVVVGYATSSNRVYFGFIYGGASTSYIYDINKGSSLTITNSSGKIKFTSSSTSSTSLYLICMSETHASRVSAT